MEALVGGKSAVSGRKMVGGMDAANEGRGCVQDGCITMIHGA